MAKHVAIVPAAGSGQRFGATPKQYTVLAGKTMLSHTVQSLVNAQVFTHVFVAHTPGDERIAAVMSELIGCEQVVLLPTGGATRAETVLNTLKQCQILGLDLNDWVWVHDAARPGITPKDIHSLRAAIDAGAKATILACQVVDTLKLATDSAHVIRTVDRQSMWSAQTPQVSQLATLIHAFNVAGERGVTVTDEAGALECVGVPIQLVQGALQNFKVTYAADAAFMEAILATRNKSYRIGEGMDVHALVVGRKLILGGIHIPFERGLLGHSDADALCHAITDAILGAAAKGDIGRMFPDTDPQFQGADSTVLLALAYQAVRQEGWVIENIDATVIAQAPKLAPYIDSMQARLVKVLGLNELAINIKAKTNENLGYLGRNEGIECRATVLLSKSI